MFDVPPNTIVPPSISPWPLPAWLTRHVSTPEPDLFRPLSPENEPVPSTVKFFDELLTVIDEGLSVPTTLIEGEFDPLSSMVTASPWAKAVGPTSEEKVLLVLSQLFVEPSPIHEMGRGCALVVTTKQQGCVH